MAAPAASGWEVGPGLTGCEGAGPATGACPAPVSPDLEALVLQKFRRQIREGAVNVIFAHDGFEALRTLEQNPNVDMVVSDINMPRMDGLSLLQKLQEAEDKDRKSTIIVSAYGDMSNIRTAMNRGAFDFLTKPINKVEMLLRVRSLLKGRTYKRAMDRALAYFADVDQNRNSP